MRVRAASAGLLGVVGLAAVLRGLRAALRWDEVALAYVAYAEPAVAALQEGRLLDALGSWVGLHPPLHAVLVGVIEVIWPSPVLWLGLSVLASWGAVVLVGRRAGVIAALALASGPIQLAYAAEVNNYPLAVLAVAGLLIAPRRVGPALLAVVALACQAHVLTALAAGALVASLLLGGGRGRREQLVLAVLSALIASPVVFGAVQRARGDGTFVQAGLDLDLWWQTASMGVGWETGALVIVGVIGVVLASPRGRWVGGALALGYGLALWSGAAAAHQRPYLALFGPVLAVGLGESWRRAGALGVRGQAVRVGLIGLLIIQLGRQGGLVLGQLMVHLDARERPRAVDLMVAESKPGDTLWLVAPALQPDDDKTATSPVFWRLSPLGPMPIARPVAFEYVDYRYGQPRSWRGRTLHTSVELDAEVFHEVASAALDGGARVWVLLYEHLPADRLQEQVEAVLEPYVHTRRSQGFPHLPGHLGAEGLGGSPSLGEDQLYLLTGVE